MVEYLQETGEFSPANPSLRAARLRVEAKAAERATRLVFCTDAARRITLERYPNLPCERLAVITNGYEETAFRDAEALRAPRNPGGRRVLLHSGTIYPGPDRDPSSLLKALRFLADRGLIAAGNFELRLRDPSHEQYFRRLAEQHGVPGLVSVMPPISYREALAEMLDADALLLLQGYSSNPAIPAKLYEYLRAARPILGLVDPAGETAATLRAACIESMAPLTDANAIADLLSRWLRAEVSLESALPPPDFVASYSRERLAERLASLLDEVADSTCTA